jgi:hypothetical protein
MLLDKAGVVSGTEEEAEGDEAGGMMAAEEADAEVEAREVGEEVDTHRLKGVSTSPALRKIRGRNCWRSGIER